MLEESYGPVAWAGRSRIMTAGVRSAMKKLLLVDSDPLSLCVLDVSLRKAGFHVTTASDGVEALEKIESIAPHLVLTDTRLPKLDGFALVRSLKERVDAADIPVVFLGAQESVEDRKRALELGVEDYLAKPVYLSELIARINLVLARRTRENVAARHSSTFGRNRFAGSTQDLALVDLLRNFELSRRTGVLHLRNGTQEAEIFFRDGRAIDADLGTLRGEEAIFRTLMWGEASFEVELKTITNEEVIEGSTSAVLMRGMHRVDEWVRLCEQVRPLAALLEINPPELLERLGRLPEIPDSLHGLLRSPEARGALPQNASPRRLDSEGPPSNAFLPSSAPSVPVAAQAAVPSAVVVAPSVVPMASEPPASASPRLSEDSLGIAPAPPMPSAATVPAVAPVPTVAPVPMAPVPTVAPVSMAPVPTVAPVTMAPVPMVAPVTMAPVPTVAVAATATPVQPAVASRPPEGSVAPIAAAPTVTFTRPPAEPSPPSASVAIDDAVARSVAANPPGGLVSELPRSSLAAVGATPVQSHPVASAPVQVVTAPRPAAPVSALAVVPEMAAAVVVAAPLASVAPPAPTRPSDAPWTREVASAADHALDHDVIAAGVPRAMGTMTKRVIWVAASIAAMLFVVLGLSSVRERQLREAEAARVPAVFAAAAPGPAEGARPVAPGPSGGDGTNRPATAAAEPSPAAPPTAKPVDEVVPSTNVQAAAPAAASPAVFTAVGAPPAGPAVREIALDTKVGGSDQSPLVKDAERALLKGQTERAVTIARQAVVENAADAEAWLTLAAAQKASGDFAGARESYRGCVGQAKTAGLNHCRVMAVADQP
jgi:CheY-like chemotaxis protein